MQSVLWHIAVLMSSLGATGFAISAYCYDEKLCNIDTISGINLFSVVCFSLASLIFLIIMSHTIYMKRHHLKRVLTNF